MDLNVLLEKIEKSYSQGKEFWFKGKLSIYPLLYVFKPFSFIVLIIYLFAYISGFVSSVIGLIITLGLIILITYGFIVIVFLVLWKKSFLAICPEEIIWKSFFEIYSLKLKELSNIQKKWNRFNACHKLLLTDNHNNVHTIKDIDHFKENDDDIKADVDKIIYILKNYMNLSQGK
ncbi:MAG: hypothetical protein ACFFAS_04995 [Promethearchaeota archaeon]